MRWNVILFRTPGNLATAVALGRVNAPHQPAAILRAGVKWPDADLRLLSVRRV
jgi:hypothetical protein